MSGGALKEKSCLSELKRDYAHYILWPLTPFWTDTFRGHQKIVVGSKYQAIVLGSIHVSIGDYIHREHTYIHYTELYQSHWVTQNAPPPACTTQDI